MRRAGSGQRLRLGVIGLGRAFMLMMPALKGDPRVELAAAADPRALARDQFERDFHAPAFEDPLEMCARNDLDAIYVASPHPHHEEHVLMAAAQGKHVMVEKPMGISVASCTRMIEACERAAVLLMVGHSHSFDQPILRCLQWIRSGRYGAVRLLSGWNYTDFMFRPRRADEFDVQAGGGVVFNQGAHHVDVARLLCGGKVERVDAFVGKWHPSRVSHGAYSALLRFEGGACANLTYSGYAHFNSDTWMDGIGELGRRVNPGKHHQTIEQLKSGLQQTQEEQLKQQRSYGAAPRSGTEQSPVAGHQHFGPLIVSCDKADLRPTALGIHVDSDEGYHFEPLALSTLERQEVLDEFLAALWGGRPLLHSGHWGRATLAVCEAIARSAQTQQGVRPEHQMAVPTA